MPPKKDEALKEAIESLARKIDEKAESTNAKLDDILRKLQETEKRIDSVEEKVRENTDEIEDLKQSMEFIDNTIEELKEKLEKGLSSEEVNKMKVKMVDLENINKRQNVVLWNVPEGSEDGKSYSEFVTNFLKNHVKVTNADSIEIQRAHRSPPLKPKNGDQKPRPIQVNLLRYTDRQRILQEAPRKLKENPYGPKQAKVIITDDLAAETRNQRNEPYKYHLKDLRDNPDVEFAYIPFLIPPRIIYKVKQGPYKHYFLPDKNQRSM